MSEEIRRNIGYSLQYLQFLDLQVKELVMSGVIEKMVYKTYIITSVSIIESMLEEVVKDAGLQTKEYWQLIDKFESNSKGKKKVVTQIYEEFVKPEEVQMKFDDILKKVRNKKLLDLEIDEGGALNRFRQLRNKVHLSNVDEGKTNWHDFTEKEYITIKFLLHSILTDRKLENVDCQSYINFLKLNEKEKMIIKDFKRLKEN